MGSQATWAAHGAVDAFRTELGEYLQSIRHPTRRCTCMARRTELTRHLHRQNIGTLGVIQHAQCVHDNNVLAEYSQDIQTSLVSALEALMERARLEGHMESYLQIHYCCPSAELPPGGQPQSPQGFAAGIG